VCFRAAVARLRPNRASRKSGASDAASGGRSSCDRSEEPLTDADALNEVAASPWWVGVLEQLAASESVLVVDVVDPFTGALGTGVIFPLSPVRSILLMVDPLCG
jgi:hypothetical protein